MKVQFAFHPEAMHVLPHLSVQSAICECCSEDNGWCIAAGWLLWSVVLLFQTPHS